MKKLFNYAVKIAFVSAAGIALLTVFAPRGEAAFVFSRTSEPKTRPLSPAASSRVDRVQNPLIVRGGGTLQGGSLSASPEIIIDGDGGGGQGNDGNDDGGGQAAFNNDPQDLPTLQVSNYTRNPGCDTCWSTSIAGVRAGDIISFRIYYHNTSNVTAVSAVADLNTAVSGDTIYGTATVSARNAFPARGSVTATLETGTGLVTLEPHSAVWYPNQASAGQSISPSPPFALGNVPGPSFAFQGDIVVRYTVRGPQGQPPSVVTGPPVNVTRTSATLTGTVNPNGASATAWFEWGTSALLGMSTAPQPAGSGNIPRETAQTLTNLTPSTEYFFRAAAANQFGTSRGAIQRFTTSSDPPPAILTVSPSAASIACGASQQFSALYDPDGAGPQEPRSVTTDAAWSSGDTGVAVREAAGLFRGVGAGTAAITALYQNVSGSATLTVGTCREPDFSLSVTPAHQTVEQGSAASYVVTVSAMHGFTGQVTLSVSGLPRGAVPLFSPSTATPAHPSTLTIDIAQHARTGTYPVIVTGISGTLTRTAPAVNLRIVPPPAPPPSPPGGGGGGNGGPPPSVCPADNVVFAGKGILTTLPATGIATSSVVMNGRVRTRLLGRAVWFEYGTDPCHLVKTTETQRVRRLQFSGEDFSEAVTGLAPGTTYFFRAVERTPFFSVRRARETLSFTTLSAVGNAPTVVTETPKNVTRNTATLHGVVTPNGLATSAWFEWGKASSTVIVTTPSQRIGSGTTAILVDHFLEGLDPETAYRVRVAAENSAGIRRGEFVYFTTLSVPPITQPPRAVTEGATNITHQSATLNGTVNPNGIPTTVWFEWGETLSLVHTTERQTAGSGIDDLAIHVSLSGLAPQTTYFVRIVASSSAGTTRGSIMSFTTAAAPSPGVCPVVRTIPTTSITQTTAMVNGTVNPNGIPTTAWFEWGTTQDLGMMTAPQPVGSASATVPYSFFVSTLRPDTTYFVRAVARNASCTAYAVEVLTFRTPR